MTSLKFDNLAGVRLAPALEIKFVGAEDGVVEGYAATFGGPPDSYGHLIAPGAFVRSLSEHQAAGTAPVFLWSHDPAAPIGRWESVREDATGLQVSGRLNLSTFAGREAHAHLRDRDITGFSIGYRVPKGGMASGNDGTILLKDLDLLEISVVAMPANTRARVTQVNSITTLSSRSELERALRGEIPLQLSRGAAAKIAAHGWPGLVGDDSDDQLLDFSPLGERIDQAITDLHALKGAFK